MRLGEREKGKRDQLRRVKFARDVLNKHSLQLWTDEICFYLDGVSFWYKTNPVAEAETPRGKIWRNAERGTESFVYCKGVSYRLWRESCQYVCSDLLRKGSPLL